MRDPVRERVGLAGARAGDDQQRRAPGLRGRAAGLRRSNAAQQPEAGTLGYAV